MLETARIYAPGWWVYAFESSVSSTSAASTTEIRDRGILPRFNALELSYLALLLGDIQRQLMESSTELESVELEWSGVQKHLSGTDQQSRERLSNVFESIAQVRFPVSTDGSHFRMVPLFTDERWTNGLPSSNSTRLRLKPSPWVYELLSGYTDGHLDLLRVVSGSLPISSIQQSISPLVLWTPVWLELSPPEQIAYVRMESAMQMEGAWLRLDGMVGCSLTELTSGIKLSRRQSEDHSPLMEKLRLVGKLGRRLVAHGLIQRDPSQGYLAVESGRQMDSPMLLWQASAERLRSKAENEYFGLVSSRILKYTISSNIDELLTIFATLSGSERTMLPVLTRAWREISEIPGVGSVFSPGIMVQAHLLFLEWCARACASSLLPLPEALRKSFAIRHCDLRSPNTAGQKFKDFLGCFLGSEDLRQLSSSVQNFSVYTVNPSSNIVSRCRDAVLNARSSMPFNRSQPQDSDARDRDLKGSISTPTVPFPDQTPSLIAEKTDPKSQNLRRLAQNELDKMIQQSPGAYADLKSKYISSLDDETKSLFMDVQRRLGSKTFDRHLKIRLVRFMVDHPSSWSSVSADFSM